MAEVLSYPAAMSRRRELRWRAAAVRMHQADLTVRWFLYGAPWRGPHGLAGHDWVPAIMDHYHWLVQLLIRRGRLD